FELREQVNIILQEKMIMFPPPNLNIITVVPNITRAIIERTGSMRAVSARIRTILPLLVVGVAVALAEFVAHPVDTVGMRVAAPARSGGTVGAAESAGSLAIGSRELCHRRLLADVRVFVAVNRGVDASSLQT
ncbi:hypothetical protein PFISCL1PPCAC_13825, partial [Pristionchus fissidentatus]